MKSSLIKVLSYENKNLQGFLINPYYEQKIYFANTAQLLFLMEDMMSCLCYPQENMESRSFNKKGSKDRRAALAGATPQEGNGIANFKINVLFRQNASWQGSIVWLNKAMESKFRSVLELLVLIDSILIAS